MCLNFVQGGGCNATSRKCLLGLRGALANNRDGECELQGRFDVWVTQANGLLITDMGFPSEEPKQCLALGVNQTLAKKIAGDKAQNFHTSVATTERRCLKCQKSYWVSEHKTESGLREIGHGYLCPHCILEGNGDVKGRLGVLRYWCG